MVLDLLVRELWLQFPHIDFTFLGFGFFDSYLFALYRMFLFVNSIL